MNDTINEKAATRAFDGVWVDNSQILAPKPVPGNLGVLANNAFYLSDP
jgi:hypothetical protein